MNVSASDMGQREPIAAVQEGMPVVDRAGEEIGTVEFVKMGDPEAVTGEGQTAGDAGLGALIAKTFGAGEPGVPPSEAARMVRLGFLKVDTKGLFARDVYVAADQVANVRQDTVELTVSRDELTKGG